MQSLLQEQVGGLTLSDSTQAPAPLVRKWSATAFPEEVLPKMEGAKPVTEHIEDLTENKPMKKQLSDEEVSDTVNFSVAEVISDQRQVQHDDSLQSDARPAYTVPVVPSFEDASEVYKNMLLKYSPRGVRTSHDAPILLKQSVQTSEEEKESDHEANDDTVQGPSETVVAATHCVREQTDDVAVESTEMLVSPTVEKSIEQEKKQQTHSVSPKTGARTQRSAKTQETSLRDVSKNNSMKAKNNNIKSRDAPLDKSNNTEQGEKISTTSQSETSSFVSSQEGSTDQAAESIKPTQRSKTKQSAGLAPLDAGRARAMVRCFIMQF